jgi:integrase
LKGIRRFTQDGVQYRYHRATGTRLPSDVPEDHPTFLQAYLAAEQAKGTPRRDRGAAPRNGTIAHAWWQFCKSDDFLDLSSGYRARMAAHGDSIIARAGTVPIDQIRPRHIQSDISDLDRNAARTRMKTWRKFLEWATPKLVQENWAQQVQMPKAKKGQRHKRWDNDQIARFRAQWGTDSRERLAFELMLFTGMRICDAVRAGDGWIDDDGWISFRQKKTGGPALIPFRCALPDFADAAAHSHLRRCLAHRPEKHITWLTTAYGTARSEKAASSWFSAACRKAGLKGSARRTAHGLRDTCCARLAEGGANTQQIMAWSGHESLSEVERYTKEVDKRAILSGGVSGTKIVQVSKS